MDAILNKLKEFKKIIYFTLCGLYALLFLCTFIYYVTNNAGVGNTFAQLGGGLGVCAILLIGLIGYVAKKPDFCAVAFALLLGSGIYNLITGFLSGLQQFDLFKYYNDKTGLIIYYVVLFLTALVGTAFAVFAVLDRLTGRDVFRNLSGIVGIAWVGMTALTIIFSIVAVADGGGWIMIVQSFYNVVRSAFLVVLATSGILAYEETEAPVAASPAEKETTEEPAEKTGE